MSMFQQSVTTGDLVFTGGKIPLIKDVPTCVAQQLRNKFNFFLGEWIMDTSIGMPYFKYVLIKNPNMILISRIFKNILLQQPGVIEIISFELLLNNSTRALTFNFKVRVDGNAVVSGGSDTPFIVETR